MPIDDVVPEKGCVSVAVLVAPKANDACLWVSFHDFTFYDRDTRVVARELLGKFLVHGERVGRIVETEAYLGADDLASHSARGLLRFYIAGNPHVSRR